MKQTLVLLVVFLSLLSCGARERQSNPNNEGIDMEQRKVLSSQEVEALATARSLVQMMIKRDVEGMRSILAEGNRSLVLTPKGNP